MRIVAIDYDSTLAEDVPPPAYAPFRKEVFEYIPKLAEKYYLVLWTGRKGYEYGEAVGRLYESGLLRYIHLDNGLEHGDTGKLVADFYIDDRGLVGGIMDWKRIFNYLMEEA